MQFHAKTNESYIGAPHASVAACAGSGAFWPTPASELLDRPLNPARALARRAMR